MPESLRRGIWGAFIMIGWMVPLSVRAEYYTFHENAPSAWQDPSQVFSELAKTSFDLLNWLAHPEDRPTPQEKYNRVRHFGTWVHDHDASECFDTRALVLIRDSQEDVTFSAGNPCKVNTGRWVDPYSGRELKLAREIEIDHVVALKNAYESGAWGWDYRHRCLYANFMGFESHLLAASSLENNRKSDKGPEGWMPLDSSFACQHLQNWLVLKLIWNLNMTPA